MPQLSLLGVQLWKPLAVSLEICTLSVNTSEGWIFSPLLIARADELGFRRGSLGEDGGKVTGDEAVT